jgi:NAD(P)-dependent dehydrogenase (short-subunit alcohol dehydrogenase family)
VPLLAPDAALASGASSQEVFCIPGKDVFVERAYRSEAPTGAVQLLDVAFVKTANNYFELFQPVSDGPIRELQGKRGDGVHHVAMRCDDVRAEWRRHDERRAEFGLIDSIPNVDSNGCSCWFLQPKKNFGVLIFATLRALLPRLREGTGSSMVALTSSALRRHPRRDVLGVAPKAAIEALVRSIAVEEGRFGVRANSVAAGMIDAGITSRLIESGDLPPEADLAPGVVEAAAHGAESA